MSSLTARLDAPVLGRPLRSWVLLVAGLALALSLPWFIYPPIAMDIACWALFAMALDLLLGYGGLLSFGHAAFFGGAAYFTAHAVKVWGWPPEAGILLGVLGAAALGLSLIHI